MNSGRKGIKDLTMDPQTVRGRAIGFAACTMCHGTFNWRTTFPVGFECGRGGFPTCVDCALVLTIDELIVECQALWRRWDDGHDPKAYEAYARACLEVWDREGRIENEATKPGLQKDWSPRKRRVINSQNG